WGTPAPQSTDAPATAGASAAVDAGASAPAVSADAEAPPPFDRKMAQSQVANRCKTLRWRCRGRDGPVAVSGTVVFSPKGFVHRVTTSDPRARTSSTGLCVTGGLRGLRIAPYSGGHEAVGFAVTID
ncbi:MAG: hypothetical protein JRI23_07140, partial [Deltaproteobacteria bacterium]|nr:hypothetical protein [Deltaproteobacteria bacterium]MBW2531367.1 hypothetical protein [Deltaproteobacteria bacterium]